MNLGHVMLDLGHWLTYDKPRAIDWRLQCQIFAKARGYSSSCESFPWAVASEHFHQDMGKGRLTKTQKDACRHFRDFTGAQNKFGSIRP